MKNQYVCDIGDYGKYSLLRTFIENGVKVGVNWYLTDNDGTNDGKFKEYLEKDDMRRYDTDVFDSLKKIYREEGNSVNEIEESGILPGAVFYPDNLSKASRDENGREKWFEQSMDYLSGAELIFMDPDNGLLVNDKTPKRKWEKYILPCEVKAYFDKGYNVVYYCHKGRRNKDDWDIYKKTMLEKLKDAGTIVLTYHKGTQRSYIFLIHDEYYHEYKKITDAVLNKWQWNNAFAFTEE